MNTNTNTTLGAVLSDTGYWIREARPKDMPALLRMGQNFIRKTRYALVLDVNLDVMSATAEMLMSSPDGIVLVLLSPSDDVVGMLGMFVLPHPLSGAVTGNELFWWVEPDHRGRGQWLLAQAEKWCKDRGATHIHMVSPDPTVDRIYKALGYEAIETNFRKEL